MVFEAGQSLAKQSGFYGGQSIGEDRAHRRRLPAGESLTEVKALRIFMETAVKAPILPLKGQKPPGTLHDPNAGACEYAAGE